jgi:glycosyltransferase involved in cell wall biosynthesis
MKNVSIIVCCYNSALKLPKTLEYLAQQKVSKDLSYEVLVVDNASTDNTAELAISYWATLNTQVSLRVVREENPGLIYARICGVKAAKDELLIFRDDDNWLREDYVQNAVDLMKANPTIGALGGQSVLAPYIDAPDWWEEHQGNYAVGKQLPETGNANKRGFVYGAGLTTRKSIAKKIFDPEYPLLLTGRKGNQCLSGEDWEYCQRTLMLGYNLYYSEKLFYWHDVAFNRLTIDKLQELLRSFEFSKSIGEKYKYIQSFYFESAISKLLRLLNRCITYLFAKTHNKDRKLELLRYQLSLCKINNIKDIEMNNILGWIKKYGK